MICPNCQGAHTTLADVEEGWNASGPHGVHTIKRHNRCRDCGHEWVDDVPVTQFDVTATYPSMSHAARVVHACGVVMRISIEQYRGQRPIDCPHCDFDAKVDLSERAHA